MKQELVDALALKAPAIAVDCTAGGGGHAELLLDAVGPQGKVLAFDQDDVAQAHLKQKFASELKASRLELVHQRFSALKTVLLDRNLFGQLDGVCADIGVSSPQLDEADRGFSFQFDGPLDMRMDRVNNPRTAADLINTASEEELANIFFHYGEEPQSRKVARAIVSDREKAPFTTTKRLAELAANVIRYKEKSRTHPATRIFQALRIVVNDELGELSQLVQDGFDALKPGGRLAIITFHSLEDRIVKVQFKKLAGMEKDQDDFRDLPYLPQDKTVAHQGKIIKPFPLTPNAAEIEANPRSRSAKIRIIEKKG